MSIHLSPFCYPLIFADINECEAIPHLCEGGKCVNTIGSFECGCPEGQSRNPNTNKCDDKDECEMEGICRDGRCVNIIGGYYCLCNPGFIQSQDKTYCVGKFCLNLQVRRYSRVFLQMDGKVSATRTEVLEGTAGTGCL